MINYYCLAPNLKRAEELRDKAVELNHPHAGGYVGVSSSGYPMVFVRFQNRELFDQWRKIMLTT